MDYEKPEPQNPFSKSSINFFSGLVPCFILADTYSSGSASSIWTVETISFFGTFCYLSFLNLFWIRSPFLLPWNAFNSIIFDFHKMKANKHWIAFFFSRKHFQSTKGKQISIEQLSFSWESFPGKKDSNSEIKGMFFVCY